jgi:hypothetical protein
VPGGRRAGAAQDALAVFEVAAGRSERVPRFPEPVGGNPKDVAEDERLASPGYHAMQVIFADDGSKIRCPVNPDVAEFRECHGSGACGTVEKRADIIRPSMWRGPPGREGHP